tara:strand:- start:1856 stop:2248 length:393 start_codon:yes stop_codon:yes gene_type:complete
MNTYKKHILTKRASNLSILKTNTLKNLILVYACFLLQKQTMNTHEINMYISKFRDEMKFKDKKQGYNFKTKINEYSQRDKFNLTYELFKYCIQKDKELENYKTNELIREAKLPDDPIIPESSDIGGLDKE